MWADFGILALGFILLIKGADIFVNSIAKLAERIGVSEFLIGLTVTAIGTSIPELASSITASLNGYSGLIIGNIIGSNIANIGLIVAVAAIIHTIKTGRKMYARDGYLVIASVLLFFMYSLDNKISSLEGYILVVFYLFYIMFVIKTTTAQDKKYTFHDFMYYIFEFEYLTSMKNQTVKKALKKKRYKRTMEEKNHLRVLYFGITKDLFFSIISIAAIIYGADLMVTKSVMLAGIFNVPQSIIGLSIIALGTSLPELVVSIKAARNKVSELVIGNVLGSNIANIFLVVGVAAIINPITVSEHSVTVSMPIMIFFSLFLLFAIKSKWHIDRKSGFLLMLAYLAFIAYSMLY